MDVEQIKAALAEALGSILYDAWKEGVTTEEQSDTLAEWVAPRLAEVIAALMPEVRASALRKAADKWQWSEWANAPRCLDRVQERIANAQFVTDWLHERAANEVTDA